MRGIFKAAASGWSLRKIARKLAEDAALGQSWDAHRVRKIVRDERYKGVMVDARIWHRANRALNERRPRRVAVAA